jgi:23S rRNA pseudouridine1911/1915/1917 synthase
MHMEVRHFLPAVLSVVGQQPVAARINPQLSGDRPHRPEKTGDFRIRRPGGKIIHRHIRPFRNHQHMDGGLGVNIVERQRRVVLKDFPARNLAAQNSGKDVILIVQGHLLCVSRFKGSGMEPLQILTLPPELQGQRLDKALHTLLPALSRTRLQDLIRQGCVTRPEGAALVDPSARVTVPAVQLALPQPAPTHMAAQARTLSILYEDAHLIVLDKPAGLVVHPAPGNPDQTLVNALLAHCGDSLTGIGGEKRPGIVHRLDKDTSGVMVAAKTAAVHADLVSQFQARSIDRAYLALVWGQPVPPADLITGNIGRHPRHRKKMAVLAHGGRDAATRYATLERFAMVSLLRCQLLTGRTHQIRVHLSHKGHPLVGDPVYSRQNRSGTPGKQPLEQLLRGFTRQALHAETLGFMHPASGAALSFKTAPPEDFQALLAQLRHG